MSILRLSRARPRHRQDHLQQSLARIGRSGYRESSTATRRQFARNGVTLLGHLQGVENAKLLLAPDLWENLAGADAHEAAFVKSVDDYIARTGMVGPEETLPVLRDGFRILLLTELDLELTDLTNIIWATSYAFDFSPVKLPVSG